MKTIRLSGNLKQDAKMLLTSKAYLKLCTVKNNESYDYSEAIDYFDIDNKETALSSLKEHLDDEVISDIKDNEDALLDVYLLVLLGCVNRVIKKVLTEAIQ